MNSYETVIGLEVHVQLATRSKLFSGASTAFGAAPNTQACAVDLGLPGVLPVLNAAAVRMAITFGLAIGAEISRHCSFDRKNYFYPDLPKGYQISQLAQPIVGPGTLDYSLPDGSARSLRIHHAHLEEDAGKSVHDLFPGQSGIDLNRAGTPLLEIVTEPDLRSATEAVAFLKRLHALVRYLGISDGNMNEGSFRCDVNVSLRPTGTDTLGERTESKNINSFRFVERAIAAEVERQESLLRGGERVQRQTMLYDELRDETRPMRSKEYADDYRYLPEPDLLPLVVSDAFVAEVRAALPEFADARRERYQRDYGLSAYDADYLTSDRATADYFEAVARIGGDAKTAANWVMGEIAAAVNEHKLAAAKEHRGHSAQTDTPPDNTDEGARLLDGFPIEARRIGALIARIRDGTLSSRTARQLLAALLSEGGEGGEVDALIAAHGLAQQSDSGALDDWIREVIAANPKQVADYRSSDPDKQRKKLGFFVGAVMKASAGKANPVQLNERLARALADSSANRRPDTG